MSDHPDTEALSAELDGESAGPDAGSGTGTHVASCPACQARLAELATVKAAIGGPVASQPADVRERAIALALAAAGADATPANDAGTRVAELRRPSPFRWWLTGSAAAAALVIVLLTAALVGGGLGGKRSDDAGTALSAGPAQDNALEAAPRVDQVTDVGDLGDVRDLPTLRSRVPARTAAALAPSADSSTGGSRSAAGSAEAPATVAGPQPRVVGTRVCEIEARSGRPQLGVVVYAGTLRYQGTAAVVLGFADAAAPAPVTLLVLAPAESCRLLAETTTP